QGGSIVTSTITVGTKREANELSNSTLARYFIYPTGRSAEAGKALTAERLETFADELLVRFVRSAPSKTAAAGRGRKELASRGWAQKDIRALYAAKSHGRW